jgi:hypothetical protein
MNNENFNAGDTIINIVSSVKTNKTLMIDKSIEKLINTAMNYKISQLQKYGVTQIVYLDTEQFNPLENTIMYFVRATYDNVRIIGQHIKNSLRISGKYIHK